MSRIGTKSNLKQPNKECLTCKHWRPAEKQLMGISLGGYCKPGYCKKYMKRQKYRK